MTLDTDRFRGCLLGLACGDAVGTTVEFKWRGSFKPLTDMIGGWPFGLREGEMGAGEEAGVGLRRRDE
jgi:ADP-ribosylglycohydrolase